MTAVEKLESFRRMTVVHGYLANLDDQEPVAARLKLPYRFAVVINLYDKDRSDECFQYPMYAELWKAMFACITHDRVTIEIDEKSAVSSLAEYLSDLSRLPEEDQDPFMAAHFFYGGRQTCYLQTWDFGYPPYGDPHTFSVYSAEPFDECLREACYAVARQFEAEITELQGLPAPSLSVWKRLQRLLEF